MQRYNEAEYSAELGCIIAKIVVADRKPRTPPSDWHTARIWLGSDGRYCVEPCRGDLIAERGAHFVIAVLLPIVERDTWHELPITWQANGTLDSACWHNVWLERFHRRAPVSGRQPVTIIGIGGVPRPAKGSVI